MKIIELEYKPENQNFFVRASFPAVPLHPHSNHPAPLTFLKLCFAPPCWTHELRLLYSFQANEVTV